MPPSSPPPSLLTRLRARWPVLFLLVTVLSFFFIPAWGRTSGRLTAYGQDWAHFPLFAGIAVMLLVVWPRRRTALAKAGVVAGMALLMALLVEIIQPLAGRSAALSDLLIGAAGSLAAVSVYMGLRTTSFQARRSLVATAGLLMLAAAMPMLLMLMDRVAAGRAFPLLDSFERPVESTRWRSDGCQLERVEEHATHGNYALRLSVPRDPDRYPGAYLNDGAMDWRGYRQLNLDVFLEGDNARGLVIRVDDRLGASLKDRAQMTFDLKPGPNRVALDITSFAVTPGGQPLELGRIASVGIFLVGARAGDAVYLDQMSLSSPIEGFQR